MATTVNLSDPGTSSHDGPYPVAIFFAFSSLIVILLLTPPFTAHWKNRNIPATVLVGATILGDLFNFLNAIIWSNDDIVAWYTGAVFCDIQIKLVVILQVVFPATIAMILRGLAQVMNTNSASWSVTAAKKRRSMAIDLVCCVGLPLFQMLASWITQPFRYYILGIAGCTVPTDGSWLYVLLSLGPPMLWDAVAAYYSGNLPAPVILIKVLLIYLQLSWSPASTATASLSTQSCSKTTPPSLAFYAFTSSQQSAFLA